MTTPSKTFYLWDLGDTLFGETWDIKSTGLPNYDAYIESLGYNLKTIDAKTYELGYERPYKDGLMKLELLPGFVETLSWTKNNAAFTTGIPEQIKWRSEVFLKKGLPDIKPFLEKIYTTFDYGNTNQKTVAIILDILKKIERSGYSTVVYSDNKLENCKLFMEAAEQLPSIKFRTYYINIKSSGLTKISNNLYETHGLLELLKNEKSLV